MSAPETEPDKYSLLPRLFKLVNSLPSEQQLNLLRQLLKGDIRRYLQKMIIDMTDTQQLKLLEKLEKIPAEEMPVKTVSLDEEETSMRGHLRKPCLIRVNYTILEQTYEGYILDISTVGVFIETSESFSVGQEMTLAFSLPNYQQMFKLLGMIVWVGHQGIGVKFQNLSPYQQEMIKSFIDKG
jgi:Tfp pilus assembly protein PilZ